MVSRVSVVGAGRSGDGLRVVSRVSLQGLSITWTVQMGGAGRSGAELRMVSRVSVGGAGRSGAGLCKGLSKK